MLKNYALYVIATLVVTIIAAFVFRYFEFGEGGIFATGAVAGSICADLYRSIVKR